jgi:CubicO group peptidase (beta-lactamase class C family)
MALDHRVPGFRRSTLCLLLGLAACAPVALPPEPDDPSVLAGQKAGIACSATYLSERALADVLVDELAGMTPAAYAIGDPEVDRASRSVSVRYAADRPPRIAVHRDGLGCTTLPPGATLADAARLPGVAPTPPPGDASSIAWPDGDLLPAAAAPAAPDAARLEAVLAAALDDGHYGESTKTIGVVVVHRGRLIAERYRPGFGPRTRYRTWSAAKSIASALVGILVGEGRLRVEEPAPVPEWRAPGDPRGGITLEHLLHMSSGLALRGSEAYAVYFGGADALAEITGAPLEAEPGSRWHYANRDTLLLVRSMRHVLGDDAAYWTFPYRALLHRIGMRSTVAELEWGGNFVLSSQVFTTARDLARFGLLYLNDGVWNGERILPEGWVAYTRERAPARPTGLAALWRYRVLGLMGYGAQFWLLGGLPFVPDDAYAAMGSRGQFVLIVPSRELVVVRTGLDPEVGDVVFRVDRFLRDVMAALPE